MTGKMDCGESGAKISFSGWGDETEQKVYRDSIDRFKTVCPGISVDYQPIPAEFQTKLKAAMAGGNAPDVFYVDDQLMTAFAPTGQLLPLDDTLAANGVNKGDFIQSLMPIFTYNGKLYALPKVWGSLGLIYLPEIFQKAGIQEPTASWTWDDLKKAAAAIKDKGGVAGYCMGADWARFAPFVYQNGGSFVSEDFKTATFDQPAVIEAGNFVASMKKDGTLVTPSDVSAGWCGEAIGKKLVGMTYEGGWMVNFMNQNYKDVQWKAVPLPKGPKGEGNILFTNGIGVNAKTKYPKASAALAAFLTGPENQAAIQKTGFAYSTHPNQLKDITNPADQAISHGSQQGIGHVAYWGPNTGKIEKSVSDALNRVFLGDQMVDQSFKQANTEIQDLLK